MSLHPDFPTSPYAPLIPVHRRFQASEESGMIYRFLYVDQEGVQRHSPRALQALAASFLEYQEP